MFQSQTTAQFAGNFDDTWPPFSRGSETFDDTWPPFSRGNETFDDTWPPF